MVVFPIENGDFPASYVSLPESFTCAKITQMDLTGRLACTAQRGPAQRGGIHLAPGAARGDCRGLTLDGVSMPLS